MNDFLKWLSTNPLAAYVILALLSFLVGALLFMYLRAFLQDREISFYPPRIGPKVDKGEKASKAHATTQDGSEAALVKPLSASQVVSWFDGPVSITRSIVRNGEKMNVREPDSRVASEILRQVNSHFILEDYDYSLERPTSNLVVIGSPRYNQHATAIQKTFHLPYQYVVSTHADVAEKSILKIVTTYGEELTSSRDKRIGPSDIEVDYGILFLANLQNNKRLAWLSGIHGAGTLGVYKFFRERIEEVLKETAAGEGNGTAWLLRVRYRRPSPARSEEIVGVEHLGDPITCKQREKPARRRIIISDLGNVIMHFDRTRTYRGIAHTCDIPYDNVKNGIENSQIRQRYELGGIDDKTFMAQLAQAIGDASDCLNENLFFELWGDIFWPNNEMIKGLKELRREGIRVILFSNTNPIHFAHVSKYYPEVKETFDEAVLSYKEKLVKPDKRFFEIAIEKALGADQKASRKDIIYIDDKEEYVETAKELGMDGFVFRSYPQFAYWLRNRGLYID